MTATSQGARLGCRELASWDRAADDDVSWDRAAPEVAPRSSLQAFFVLGRLIAVDTDALVIADEGGQACVAYDPVDPKDLPRPGDIVRIDLASRVPTEAPRVSRVHVLTPYRREVPFPSPGGEFFRLHGGAHDRVTALRRRAELLAAIRGFFADRGYLEVEVPQRVYHPGLEPHLVAAAAGPSCEGRARYLITSPEYHMKRLLAAGLERIFFLGKCWREEEASPWHLGEFTMLEWYHAFSDIEALREETEALLRHVAACLGDDAVARLPRDAFARITVAEACRAYADIDLDGVVDPRELARRARAAGFDVSDDEGFESILARILVERVEPALATSPGVFLCDYPAPVAALARLRDDDPSVAERFELYMHGAEIANAFGELTDPDEQRRRFEAEQRQRRAAGLPVHEIDERFLEALREGIPPSAGIALGVDRILAILLGTEHIGETVAFRDDEL